MTVHEYLKSNILLFDGAMGTYYASLSQNPTEKCEYGNINEPGLILSIHREYIDAGCKAIKTNTFGANRALLGHDMKTVIEEAWRLAEKAVENKDVFVFADIGQPPENSENMGEGYREIADIFLELGADNFLFETLDGGEYLKETAAYIKSKKPETFIICSFAINPDGFTSRGMSGYGLLKEMWESGVVDAAGFNCMSGPAHLLRSIPELGGELFSIMPNGGYPTVVGRKTIYSGNAGYFAGKLCKMAKKGAKILGGCCGTDPKFIAAAAKRIYDIPAAGIKIESGERPSMRSERLPDAGWQQKLDDGKKAVAVELDPPLDCEIEKYLTGVRQLQEAGIDLITIADCPIARSRMDSSIIACKIRREMGIDVMPHMTCRDRNLNATKALLLGLAMEGVHSVLIVTGDPVPSAERDSVKSVYNFNSRMLAAYISGLNDTVFGTPFYICGALNVNARNFDVQLRLGAEKVKNGVKTFFTQPVLTEAAAENLKRAGGELDAKIMGGIMPVVSYRNACFMNNEISGIEVSEEIAERYRDKPRDVCTRLAVEISLKIAERIKRDVDGYYLITPFNRTDIISEIARNLQ